MLDLRPADRVVWLKADGSDRSADEVAAVVGTTIVLRPLVPVPALGPNYEIEAADVPELVRSGALRVERRKES